MLSYGAMIRMKFATAMEIKHRILPHWLKNLNYYQYLLSYISRYPDEINNS